MASLRQRVDTGTLFFDLRWDGKRVRAQTELSDTPENRASLEPKLMQVNAALKRGTFSLESFFPELATAAPAPSRQAVRPTHQGLESGVTAAFTPQFSAFTDQWFNEFKVGWRKTYITTVRGILDQHLLPRFGSMAIGAVTRAQILEFRMALAAMRGRRPGTKLSPARINTIMLILRQILQEAADRYEFTMPMGRLKPLKVPSPTSNPSPWSKRTC